jgi:hypothetical protein
MIGGEHERWRMITKEGSELVRLVDFDKKYIKNKPIPLKGRTYPTHCLRCLIFRASSLSSQDVTH